MQLEILGISEVAKLLSVNEWTIYRLIKEGRIPAFKVGKQWRFKKATLERWMDSQSNIERSFDSLIARLRADGASRGLAEEDIEKIVQSVRGRR